MRPWSAHPVESEAYIQRTVFIHGTKSDARIIRRTSFKFSGFSDVLRAGIADQMTNHASYGSVHIVSADERMIDMWSEGIEGESIPSDVVCIRTHTQYVYNRTIWYVRGTTDT